MIAAKCSHMREVVKIIVLASAIVSCGAALRAADPELPKPTSYIAADDGRTHCVLDVACVRVGNRNMTYILDVVGDPLPDEKARFQRIRDLLLVRYDEQGTRTESLIGKVERPSMLSTAAMRIVPRGDGTVAVLARMADDGYALCTVTSDGRVVQTASLKGLYAFDAAGLRNGAQLAVPGGSGKRASIRRLDVESGKMQVSSIGQGGVLAAYTAVVPDGDAGGLIAAGVSSGSADPVQPDVKVIAARISADDKKLAETSFAGEERVLLARAGKGLVAILYSAGQKTMLRFLTTDDLATTTSVELPYTWSTVSGAAIIQGPRDGTVWLAVPDSGEQHKNYVLLCYDVTGRRLGSWRLLPDSSINTLVRLASDGSSLVVGFSGNPGDDAKSPRWQAKVLAFPISAFHIE